MIRGILLFLLAQFIVVALMVVFSMWPIQIITAVLLTIAAIPLAVLLDAIFKKKDAQ